MAARSVSSIGVIGLLLVVLTPAARAADFEVVEKRTLRDLGYRQPHYTVYPRADPNHRSRFSFRLPENAKQGPSLWYLVDLRFELRLDPRTGPGVAYVSALTNGYAASQTRFKVTVREGRQSTQVASFDLVKGRRERLTSDNRIAVTSTNYLQLKGVRPGRNTLKVELERYGRVRVRSVRVSNRSAILSTHQGPPELSVRVKGPTSQVRVGDAVPIAFRLANKGMATGPAIVSLKPTTPQLGDIEPARMRFHRGADRDVTGVFRIRALRAGTGEMTLLAQAPTANVAGAVIRLRVEPAADSGDGALLSKAILGVVFLPALSMLLVSRLLQNRRRRSP